MTDTPRESEGREVHRGDARMAGRARDPAADAAWAGLEEEFKWYKPCYTHDGSNIVIFQPFKEMCALLFFKGALLEDPDGALKEQGENTRSALRLEFRSVADVTAAKRTIVALVKDAIRVEQAGLSSPTRDPADEGPYPEELVHDCSTPIPACATRGSASPPAAGAAGYCTSTAPSSPRPASRGSSAPRHRSWKASGCTTTHDERFRWRKAFSLRIGSATW